MELQTAPDRNGTGPEPAFRTGPELDLGTGPESTPPLSAAQAAARLGITDRTLRKYARAGRLTRAFGPEGHPSYQWAEVEALRVQLQSGGLDSGPERHGVRTGPARSPDRPGMEPDRPGPAAEEIAFLRAQIEVKDEQLRRRDAAEAELRRLLLMSQQQLTAALERPMLPAPDFVPKSRESSRVRWWWQIWRRKV